MQFEKLPLQLGSSVRFFMQFENLPLQLQPGSSHVAPRNYPAVGLKSGILHYILFTYPISVYQHYFNTDVQPSNLAKLTEQYIWRTIIDLEREINLDARGDAKTLKLPVLNIVGSYR
jgi:hypothetical protein